MIKFAKIDPTTGMANYLTNDKTRSYHGCAENLRQDCAGRCSRAKLPNRRFSEKSQRSRPECCCFPSVIPDICFCRIRAEIFDGALRTFGLLCHANAAAMVLHQMTEADALFGRDDCRQVSFDFVRVGFAGES
jgi:hypothetical protein